MAEGAATAGVQPAPSDRNKVEEGSLESFPARDPPAY
jgi:hypothetical protein